MARKLAKSKLDEFENVMIGGIIALGGIECCRLGYDWELATLHGELLINIQPSLLGVHTRFEVIPDVAPLYDVKVNPYSGVWNHYRLYIGVPRVAAGQLIDILSLTVFGVRASHRAHLSQT